MWPVPTHIRPMLLPSAAKSLGIHLEEFCGWLYMWRWWWPMLLLRLSQRLNFQTPLLPENVQPLLLFLPSMVRVLHKATATRLEGEGRNPNANQEKKSEMHKDFCDCHQSKCNFTSRPGLPAIKGLLIGKANHISATLQIKAVVILSQQWMPPAAGVLWVMLQMCKVANAEVQFHHKTHKFMSKCNWMGLNWCDDPCSCLLKAAPRVQDVIGHIPCLA